MTAADLSPSHQPSVAWVDDRFVAVVSRGLAGGGGLIEDATVALASIDAPGVGLDTANLTPEGGAWFPAMAAGDGEVYAVWQQASAGGVPGSPVNTAEVLLQVFEPDVTPVTEPWPVTASPRALSFQPSIATHDGTIAAARSEWGPTTDYLHYATAPIAGSDRSSGGTGPGRPGVAAMAPAILGVWSDSWTQFVVNSDTRAEE